MILLDTHVWLWAVSDPARLSRTAANAIERADRIGVSAISCWEVAMLVAHRRIALDRPVELWLEQALASPHMELCALTANIAVLSTQFRAFHGDPADRMIVATAKLFSATLLTRDAKIRKSRLCEVVTA